MSLETQVFDLEEFDMLLNEVLREMANPMPTQTLQEKVTLRLRTAMQNVEPVSVKEGQLVLSFTQPPERRGPRSIVLAFALHAAAILLAITLFRPRETIVHAPLVMTSVLDTLASPIPAAPSAKRMAGGGGQHDAAPVSKGTPPKYAPVQIVPPKTAPTVTAKLEVPPTIDLQNLKMASAMPEVGMPSAPSVGASMGEGEGSGIGAGRGSGLGPGLGGNTGGGVKEVGGSVSAPVEIYRVDPEFSEEARRAKLSGSVFLNLWVDQSGRPTHIRVLCGLGMGLDERAIDAVKQFRFRPAMENGKPVTVELNIEVGFHIY